MVVGGGGEGNSGKCSELRDLTRVRGRGAWKELIVQRVRNGRLFRKYERFDCTNTEEESKEDICFVRST